jgi:hypothetical protein
MDKDEHEPFTAAQLVGALAATALARWPFGK